MTISKLYVLTTFLAFLSYANLCAMGAGPAGQPPANQQKKSLPLETSLKERSAIALAQKMFDGAKGAPTIADLEDANITPAPVAKAIFKKLYELCIQHQREFNERAVWRRIVYKNDPFYNKQKWLGQWFAQKQPVKTSR